MGEVPMSDVVAKLKLADTAQIVVLDVDGQQVPYQGTYDEKYRVLRSFDCAHTGTQCCNFNRTYR